LVESVGKCGQIYQRSLYHPYFAIARTPEIWRGDIGPATGLIGVVHDVANWSSSSPWSLPSNNKAIISIEQIGQLK
jgi:hypothetical protein